MPDIGPNEFTADEEKEMRRPRPPAPEGPAQVPRLRELEKGVKQPGVPVLKWWKSLRGQ